MYTNNNFSGDTMCLDLFLEDCIRNKEKHDMLIKKKNKSGKIISFIALIGFVSIVLCMFFNPNLAIPLFLLVFGVMAFSIIGSAFLGHKTEKLEQEIYSGGDGIDYSNIDNFLSSNQMHRFDDLKGSFCVNNKSTLIKEKKKKNSFVLFFVLWGLFPLIGFALLLLNNIDLKQEGLVIMVCMMTIFLGVSIGMFVWGVLPILNKYIICNYKTNAACVEVYSKVSRDSDGDSTTVYRPFYYIKHEGLGYILCPNSWSNVNVPEVGDLKEDFYINPNNPFEYRVKGDWKMLLFYLIFVVAFSVPFVIVLGTIILNGGF